MVCVTPPLFVRPAYFWPSVGEKPLTLKKMPAFCPATVVDGVRVHFAIEVTQPVPPEESSKEPFWIASPKTGVTNASTSTTASRRVMGRTPPGPYDPSRLPEGV